MVNGNPRVLLMMLGGIGDMVLFMPTLQALRQAYPKSRISLLTGQAGVEGIIDGEGYADEVLLLNRQEGPALTEALGLILRIRREKCDLALASSGTHALKASLMMYLMGIPQRVGMDVDKKGFWFTQKLTHDPQENESEGSLRLIEAIGIKVLERYPCLHLSSNEKSFADGFLTAANIEAGDLIIGIHAGSGPKLQDQKRWPPERFAQLADHLIRHLGAKVIFTGAGGEKGLMGQITAMMKETPISAVGKLNLRQTAAVIGRCRVFVSNDSGIAHVASAVKTPLIVLFGATDLGRIGPRGGDVHVIRKEGGIRAIMVDEVFEQVRKRIAHAAP